MNLVNTTRSLQEGVSLFSQYQNKAHHCEDRLLPIILTEIKSQKHLQRTTNLLNGAILCEHTELNLISLKQTILYSL